MYIVLATFGALAIFLLLHFINPYSVQVDRWSAIHNFIQNLFAGQYPYAAHTHLGGYGSPFPVWQFFHIPFYLLGDVGLAGLFSFILIVVLLFWLFNSYRQSLLFLIFLIISPAFWYEVAVRSDLLYNMFLCFLCIGILYKKKFSIINQYIIVGVLCGLFLSTRLPIVIPFSLFLFPSFFKAKTKAKAVFIIIVITVFVLSFLPFIFWDSQMIFFFKYNPFILQTRQGSIFEVLVLAILGIYLSFRWKTIDQCFFYTSICLTLTVVISFLYRMAISDFANSLFSVSYDITYFNMALPFIIFTLSGANITLKKVAVI
jgi:hypothetical protein